MYRLFLAMRYLWSRPISWVAMVAIWLSVMAMIATIAVMSGFLRETKAMIRGTASDIVVTPRTKFDGRSADGTRATFAEIDAVVTAVDGVKGLAPRLVRPVILRTGLHKDIVGMSQLLDMQHGKLFGVDPAAEAEASDFARYVAKAEADVRVDDPARPFWLEPQHVRAEYANQDLPVVLLGEDLLRWYRLEKGDVITLVTVPERVDLKAIKPLSQRFLVGGAVRSGHYEFDRSQLWVSLDTAREFTQHEADCSEIALAAQPGVELDVLRDRLIAAFEAADLVAEVETWMDRDKQFLGAVENERAIMGVILGFFVLVACFNVFATLTIMVTDKTKDIGILNAMGATAGGMTGIFLYSGLIMALFSAAVGCASGVGLARSLNAINDAIERFFGLRIFRADIYLFREIPVQIDAELVVGVFVGTVVLAVLFAMLPAVRAARMDPIRALRYE